MRESASRRSIRKKAAEDQDAIDFSQRAPLESFFHKIVCDREAARRKVLNLALARPVLPCRGAPAASNSVMPLFAKYAQPAPPPPPKSKPPAVPAKSKDGPPGGSSKNVKKRAHESDEDSDAEQPDPFAALFPLLLSLLFSSRLV